VNRSPFSSARSFFAPLGPLSCFFSRAPVCLRRNDQHPDVTVVEDGIRNFFLADRMDLSFSLFPAPPALGYDDQAASWWTAVPSARMGDFSTQSFSPA